MPGMDGIETTRKLHRLDPDVKFSSFRCVMMICYPRVYYKLALWLSDQRRKVKSELTRAIQAVHSGQRYISPGIANQLAESN